MRDDDHCGPNAIPLIEAVHFCRVLALFFGTDAQMELRPPKPSLSNAELMPRDYDADGDEVLATKILQSKPRIRPISGRVRVRTVSQKHKAYPAYPECRAVL